MQTQPLNLEWISFQLPAKQKKRLRIRAAHNGTSVSEEIRRAIDILFEQEPEIKTEASRGISN